MTDESTLSDRTGSGSTQRLLESALADQRMRWRSGAGELVEKQLERYPELRSSDDSILDLIYNEVLLRRECGSKPTLAEYLQRFPGVAESLRMLFEVDAGIDREDQNRSVEPTPIAALLENEGEHLQVGGSGESYEPRLKQQQSTPDDAIAPRFVAGSSVRGTVELNALLQRRLRFMSIVTMLVYLQSGWQLRTFWHIDQWPFYRLHMAIVWSVLTIAIICSVFLLLRRRPLAVGWLRTIEVVLVAAPLVQLTAVLVDMTWLQGDLLRALRTPGHDSGYLFNSMALFYFPVIACYGVLIPNTFWRCLIVALTIALLPLSVLLGGLPFTPEIWTTYREPFFEGFLWVAMWVGVAVACSVYGCHRINVLQREAFIARRLGQYRLRQRLGSGGMGEVYLAEHVLLKQPCAVKIIRPERAGDPAALRRFEREVQATARLKHWNTVTIYDYGIAADGTFYYAMEYLPGLNLEDMVRRFGPLPPARVCHLLRQACSALQEAHAIGLIHRDIKPANLIVCERGGVHDVVKVLDFGLVRDVSAGNGQSCSIDGVIAGTPAYMSPEQASGARELDARSDVYSLGAVAYFAITGQPPFGYRSHVQVLAAHLYESPRPLAELIPQVPEELAQILMRSLAKRPDDRFPDARSLAAALDALADTDSWTSADAAGWWSAHHRPA
ncbi:MAG: serine/threonine-protein kinase [Pirellulales bacterium]